MLRFRSSSINGVQHLNSIHGVRQLALYSTSKKELSSKFANFLVKTLGFSRKKAASISSAFSHRHLARGIKTADSVITFFEEIGLQKSHIRDFAAVEPRILLCKVEKNLTRKTQAIQELGFSRPLIADLICANASIYFVGLNSAIIPAIQCLKETMGCDDDVIRMLKVLRGDRLTAFAKCTVPNVAFLRSYGVPVDLIRRFVLSNPPIIAREPDVFAKAVMSVEEILGIPRNHKQFLAGAHILATFSEKNVKSKMEIFKNFGWTDSVITTLLLAYPYVLSLSLDIIRKKLDFLMNKLGYKPSYLAKRCHLLSYNLQKRVVSRHKVLVVLKENGLIRTDYTLESALCLSESFFLGIFVLPFKEVHSVYIKHAGVSLEMLTRRSSSSIPNSSVV